MSCLVLVLLLFLIPRSHLTLVRSGMYEQKGLVVFTHIALSNASSSAGTLYSMLLLQSGSVFVAENIGSLKRRIRWAYFVLSHRAPKTILEATKMLTKWLLKLPRQLRALQRHHAVSKAEVGEIAETKNDDDEAIV